MIVYIRIFVILCAMQFSSLEARDETDNTPRLLAVYQFDNQAWVRIKFPPDEETINFDFKIFVRTHLGYGRVTAFETFGEIDHEGYIVYWASLEDLRLLDVQKSEKEVDLKLKPDSKIVHVSIVSNRVQQERLLDAIKRSEIPLEFIRIPQIRKGK